MIPLYEQFRPRSLAEVVGQPKAVKAAQRIIDNGAGGQAMLITGPSGTGKTTIAEIIAASIAAPDFIERYNATDLTSAMVKNIANRMNLYGGWIRDDMGGRAVIVNECHRLDADALTRVLDATEPIPSHVCWLFTTTWDGQEQLFARQIDAEAFESRCLSIKLTNQGTAAPFAALAERIAVEAGLNGCSNADKVAMKIVRECNGNMRAVLRRIESGCMVGDA